MTERRQRSSSEVKQEYQDKLGVEFGTIFHALVNNWCWGTITIRELRILTRAEDAKPLRAIMGGFLLHVQWVFWENLILLVSKLTDPVSSGKGKDNLTILKLPELCEDAELHCEVSSRVNTAIESGEFARDWRNRVIAHTDLSRVIGPNPEPLASASIEKVGNALDEIHSVLNYISIRLLDSQIGNKVVIEPRAGAFIAHTKQLAKAVQYIDSAIDPSGDTPITDSDVASDFLGKIGRRPNAEQMNNIFELREAAGRFR